MFCKKSTLKNEIDNRIDNYQKKKTEYKVKITRVLVNQEIFCNFDKLYNEKGVRKPDEMYKEFNAEYFETGEITKASDIVEYFESQLNKGFG